MQDFSKERRQASASSYSYMLLCTSCWQLLSTQWELWLLPYAQPPCCCNLCKLSPSGLWLQTTTFSIFKIQEVLCDLGTDCTDCGPWVYKLDESESSPPKPVSALRAEGILIVVDKTRTVPEFLMPYSDHEKDVDVSSQLYGDKIYERGLSMVRSFLWLTVSCTSLQVILLSSLVWSNLALPHACSRNRLQSSPCWHRMAWEGLYSHWELVTKVHVQDACSLLWWQTNTIGVKAFSHNLSVALVYLRHVEWLSCFLIILTWGHKSPDSLLTFDSFIRHNMWLCVADAYWMESRNWWWTLGPILAGIHSMQQLMAVGKVLTTPEAVICRLSPLVRMYQSISRSHTMQALQDLCLQLYTIVSCIEFLG